MWRETVVNVTPKTKNGRVSRKTVSIFKCKASKMSPHGAIMSHRALT